jgi:hypothetical protein
MRVISGSYIRSYLVFRAGCRSSAVRRFASFRASAASAHETDAGPGGVARCASIRAGFPEGPIRLQLNRRSSTRTAPGAPCACAVVSKRLGRFSRESFFTAGWRSSSHARGSKRSAASGSVWSDAQRIWLTSCVVAGHDGASNAPIHESRCSCRANGSVRGCFLWSDAGGMEKMRYRLQSVVMCTAPDGAPLANVAPQARERATK